MNSFSSTRHRRSLLDINGFSPIHFPVTNYSTSAHNKEEMKHTFGDGLFLNNLHLISDPLKKNLADSVISGEESLKKMTHTKEFTIKEARPQRADYYPSLAGITNFISGVLNVMGGIFHKRAPSPTSQYYDCFDSYDEHQVAPSWQSSKNEVQNKNEQDKFASNEEVSANLEVEMSLECKIAASHCEEKLNQVRLLFSKKHQNNVSSPKFRPKRPRKAFFEAGSVEESFEDAFSPEDFISLPNKTFLECYSPYNCHNNEFTEADAPKTKTEISNVQVKESMDIINNVPNEYNKKDILNDSCAMKNKNLVTTKEELISSCENKLNEIKALLQSKCNKSTNNEKDTKTEFEITKPIPIPSNKPETVFGDELNSSELDDSQNYSFFNEVTGKFFSSSVESEDSFQIVFSDGPSRRIPSDCESEDSFIVFEESPDSCYSSHDVFGTETICDDNDTDSDSDIEEDSGITCKLSHNLSRTFGDLTDDSLYSRDVVDSVQINEVNPCENIENEVSPSEKTGLLLDERKKIVKRQLPPKKVTFSSEPPKVHLMRVWAYAARQARAGHWERYALDRERFKRRIADVEMAISWVLKRQHRSRIVFQRFRPWWNAEARRELAEKKAREEKEKEHVEQVREIEGDSSANVKNTSNNVNNIDNMKAKESDTDSDDVTNIEENVNDIVSQFKKCMILNSGQSIETNQEVDKRNEETVLNNNSNLFNVSNSPQYDQNLFILSNDINTHSQNRCESDVKCHNNDKNEGNNEIRNEFKTVQKLNGVKQNNDKLANKTHNYEIKDAKLDT